MPVALQKDEVALGKPHVISQCIGQSEADGALGVRSSASIHSCGHEGVGSPLSTGNDGRSLSRGTGQ